MALEPGALPDAWFRVALSTIPGAGRGVFALRAFRKGDVVMRAPVVQYPREEVSALGVLAKYLGVSGDTAFLSFDYQGLVNTAQRPEDNNVRAEWRLAEGISQFVALRDIHVGEELFQHYQGSVRLN